MAVYYNISSGFVNNSGEANISLENGTMENPSQLGNNTFAL